MVSFVLGPHTVALDPRDLNLGPHEDDPTGRSVDRRLSTWVSSDVIFLSTCIAAIVDGGPTFPFVILGGSALVLSMRGGRLIRLGTLGDSLQKSCECRWISVVPTV